MLIVCPDSIDAEKTCFAVRLMTRASAKCCCERDPVACKHTKPRRDEFKLSLSMKTCFGASHVTSTLSCGSFDLFLHYFMNFRDSFLDWLAIVWKMLPLCWLEVAKYINRKSVNIEKRGRN